MERERDKDRERRPAAPVGELWANGLKGTSVGLIALIFTRLADGEERELRSV